MPVGKRKEMSSWRKQALFVILQGQEHDHEGKRKKKKNQTRPSSPQQDFTHNCSFVEGPQVERPCGEPRRGRRLSLPAGCRADQDDDDQQNDHNRPKLIRTATRYPPLQETASQIAFQQVIGCGEPFRDRRIKQAAGLAGTRMETKYRLGWMRIRHSRPRQVAKIQNSGHQKPKRQSKPCRK
jgi:hypothetical protein